MEDFTTLSDLISNIGFPIAMCVIMAWYVYKMNEEHKEEVKNLSEAINNNTIVMSRVLENLNQKKLEV